MFTIGFSMKTKEFDEVLKSLKKEYRIFAPVVFEGTHEFSNRDIIRYAEIESVHEIVFDRKSDFSPKEVLSPITETLFYFTENKFTVPEVDEKKILLFLRACDINGLKRLDEIYLRNGEADNYYKRLREKIRYVLMECEESFQNCFCVSMDSNKTEEYSLFVKVKEDTVLIECREESLRTYFNTGKEEEVLPKFREENQVKVNIPEELDQRIFGASMWKEYDHRCIACGRCNFVCPTCTCFTMQDIFYKDNPKSGERRRVWASCHVDGYTDMAGGHSFRKRNGERMRFKVLHKVYDFKKVFGYHMCVGCGRCDDVCPEYISFWNCINKLESAMEEVK